MTTQSNRKEDVLARQAIRHLLAGNPPNGTKPADCGLWADRVEQLYEAHKAQRAGFIAEVAGDPMCAAAWRERQGKHRAICAALLHPPDPVLEAIP